MDNNNVVYNHACFFAKTDGELTYKSMTKGHSDQGITSGVDIKARAISNLLDDRKLPHNCESLATVNNPASSGIWDKEGKFCEERFNELCKNSVKNEEGFEVLTASIFHQFLEKLHEGEKLGNATYIAYVIPVSWKKVTEGSVNELFTYYSDATFEGKNAMTRERMREFYTNPNKVMQERIASLKG